MLSSIIIIRQNKYMWRPRSPSLYLDCQICHPPNNINKDIHVYVLFFVFTIICN
ncbi:hypothetical protein Hanom_Chr16g01461181 [Helianthus anomalus]